MSPKESIVIFGFSNWVLGAGGPGHHGSGTGSDSAVLQLPLREMTGSKRWCAIAALAPSGNRRAPRQARNDAPATMPALGDCGLPDRPLVDRLLTALFLPDIDQLPARRNPL